MNSLEIKNDLFKKIEELKSSNIEKVYGLLLNYINGSSSLSDWDDLTPVQQEAIEKGINQLEKGKSNTHSDLMAEMRLRYT